MGGGMDCEPVEVKKFYILSAVRTKLTVGNAVDSSSGADAESRGRSLSPAEAASEDTLSVRLQPVPAVAAALEQLGGLLTRLEHPFITPVLQLTAEADTNGRPKAVLLRDFAARGSIRDMLLAESNPLRSYKEKYIEADGSAYRLGRPISPPNRLWLFAKQVAVAMQFLAAVGIDPSFVHTGNVLLSTADGSTPGAESVALTDVENSFLFATTMDDAEAICASHTVDSAAVAAYGRLLYEMATGHLLESPPILTAEVAPDASHTDRNPFNSVDSRQVEAALPRPEAVETVEPAELRPLLRTLLGLPSPKSVKTDLWADEPTDSDAKDTEGSRTLSSLSAVLAHPALQAVELSDTHTAAFPTDAELPGLATQTATVQKALASVTTPVEPDKMVTNSCESAADPTQSDTGSTVKIPALEVAELETGSRSSPKGVPMPAELLDFLSQCCGDNTHKPPASILKKTVASALEVIPDRQVAVARWLAQRLDEGLAEPGGSIAVSMKTTQLLMTLIKAAEARSGHDAWADDGVAGGTNADALTAGTGKKGLKGRGKRSHTPKKGAIDDPTGIVSAIGTECGVALKKAQKFSRLDPLHGTKPAKLINHLAKQVAAIAC
eukprot:SAG31_NODE_4102_length_3582_cov_1.665518_1_plen_610_part_00